MTEPKEFNSIDDLYKKALDNMSDAPSPNGWDTPSPRVWENVQKQVARPSNPLSVGKLLLLGLGIAGLATVGTMVWRSQKSKALPAATPTESPVATPIKPVENTTQKPSILNEETSKPEADRPAPADVTDTAQKTKPAVKGKTKAKPSTKDIPTNDKPVLQDRAKPAKPKNSTELEKLKQAEK